MPSLVGTDKNNFRSQKVGDDARGLNQFPIVNPPPPHVSWKPPPYARPSVRYHRLLRTPTAQSLESISPPPAPISLLRTGLDDRRRARTKTKPRPCSGRGGGVGSEGRQRCIRICAVVVGHRGTGAGGRRSRVKRPQRRRQRLRFGARPK